MIDAAITAFDRGLRTLFVEPRSVRAYPGGEQAEVELDEASRRHAASLMRVNHVGEICAQALYLGQAVCSRDSELIRELGAAAAEEEEHLAWTSRRINELGSHQSLLNPLWFTSSLMLGMGAAVFGRGKNLGFLEETERQVGAHLLSHLQKLPENDLRSRAIVGQMLEDELKHADAAHSLGASELPRLVKVAMKFAARFMTTVAHRI